MKIPKKIISTINIFLLLATVSLFVFEVRLLTVAQGVEDAAATETESPSAAEPIADLIDQPSKCAENLKQYLVEKQLEFGEFMNNHFRSDKPTSELIPAAIQHFAAYRKEVREKVEELILPSGKSIGGENKGSIDCESAMKEDFSVTGELMREHIMQNAYAKKSTRLIDKYKEINNKLEKLNFTIAQMYGYFGALSQRLPCYATNCIKG